VKDIESNNGKTGYLHHILITGHECGKFENTLEILNLQRTHWRSSTHTRYKENNTGQLLNEVRTDQYNPLFELLV
jgi:hypothetical protein